MVCHYLLKVIFPIQRSNPHLLRLLYWQVNSLPLSYLRNHCSPHWPRTALLPEILFSWRHQSCFFTSFWTSSNIVLMVKSFLSTLKLPVSTPDTYDSPFLFVFLIHQYIMHSILCLFILLFVFFIRIYPHENRGRLCLHHFCIPNAIVVLSV